MVGPEHVDNALLEAAPDHLLMITIADRRIHLGARTEPLVAVRRRERQMVRSSLDRSDILVVTQELHLLCGRNVQNMDALAGLAREANETLRAGQRSHVVAPDRMRARIARHAQVLALIEPVLVFGVKRGAAPNDLEDVAHTLVVLDQQRARGRAHEYLHASAARQPFELRQRLRILAGASHEEGKIAVHPMMPASHLVRERLRAGCSRLGIGHLKDSGDAAHHRTARAGFEILLVSQAGLAEVHLGIDHTRQNMQASTIDGLARGGLRQVTKCRDASTRNAKIARAFPVVIDDSPTLEDQIVALCHPACRSCSPASRPYVRPYVSWQYLASTRL